MSSSTTEAPRQGPGAPRRRAGWARWAREGALFALVFVVISAVQARNLVPTGTAAPPLDLPALGGGSVSLAALRGKTVLVHFWATWCGVCRQEPPALNAAHEGRRPDEVVLSVVADSDDPNRVRRFAADHGIRYPVLLGTPEALAAFHVGAFPTNYFIGPGGEVKSRTVGMSTRQTLAARLWLARNWP